MLGTITITVFVVGLRIAGADRIEVFGTRDALARWSDPIPVTDSTEWRSTLYVEAGGSIILPPGAYRVECYNTIIVNNAAPLDWNVPTVRTWSGPGDINADGEITDADCEAFFRCIGGECGPTESSDYDHDEDAGTDADIQAFMDAWLGRNPAAPKAPAAPQGR